MNLTFPVNTLLLTVLADGRIDVVFFEANKLAGQRITMMPSWLHTLEAITDSCSIRVRVEPLGSLLLLERNPVVPTQKYRFLVTRVEHVRESAFITVEGTSESEARKELERHLRYETAEDMDGESIDWVLGSSETESFKIHHATTVKDPQ